MRSFELHSIADTIYLVKIIKNNHLTNYVTGSYICVSKGTYSNFTFDSCSISEATIFTSKEEAQAIVDKTSVGLEIEKWSRVR